MNRSFKLTRLAVAALMLLFGASLAMADPITAGDIIRVTSDPNRDTSYGGGAFLVQEKTGPNTWGPAFQTFCLELNEHIGFGGVYLVNDVSKDAIAGGVAGGNPDPISMETAWLYYQFRLGAPIHPAGSTIAERQRGIQEAIWAFEQEKALPATGYAGHYHALALAAPLDEKQFAYDLVTVINPVTVATDQSITLRQSLLQTPVPEPGSLVLIGSGLLGLAVMGLRRRNRS